MTSRQVHADADSVRAVLEEIFAAQKYQWDLPPNPFAWLIDTWWRMLAWLTRLEVEHPGAYYALVVGLVVLLVAILVHLGYLTVLAFRRREDDEGEPVERLRAVRDAAWHLSEARRLETEGDYSASLVHRFAALIFLLDRKHVIRAHPSKTPAEYLHEAQLGPVGREVFSDTVEWLYDHIFGGRPLTAPALAEFDRRAKEVLAHGPA